MINCPAETTEGSGASSCSGALDMNSGNFCLRTANVCAGNMLGCKDKADKYTSSIAIFVVRTYLEKDQPKKAKQ